MSNNDAYAAAELASSLREEPGKPVRSWAGLIDDKRTLRYLNYLDDRLDQPIEQTERGRRIIANAATETIDESVRNGNVGQMKSATGMTNNSSTEGAFFWEVASRLAHEGTVGLVFGSPGSGKTAKMLDVGMAWKGRTNGRMFGNISADVLDAEFYSDREMFEEMAAFKGQSLALIDEVAQELDGMGSRNTQATEFCNRMRMIRKKEDDHGPYAKRGSALLVAHTRNGTAKDIRRMASFAIEVPNKRNPGQVTILDSKDGSDEWNRYESYSGITDTDAAYNEHQASKFEIIDEDDDGGEYPHRPDNWEEIQLALTRHIEDDMKRADAIDHPRIDAADPSTVSLWKSKYGNETWTPEDDE